MPGVRLGPEIERRLAAIAEQAGRTKSYYVRKAVRQFIEDWEDTAAAIRALEHPGRRWSLDELMAGSDVAADNLEH